MYKYQSIVYNVKLDVSVSTIVSIFTNASEMLFSTEGLNDISVKLGTASNVLISSTGANKQSETLTKKKKRLN
jgi:hypothetical protein